MVLCHLEMLQVAATSASPSKMYQWSLLPEGSQQWDPEPAEVAFRESAPPTWDALTLSQQPLWLCCAGTLCTLPDTAAAAGRVENIPGMRNEIRFDSPSSWEHLCNLQ